MQAREPRLRVPAKRVRPLERGLGGLEAAEAQLDVAEHAVGVPFGTGAHADEPDHRGGFLVFRQSAGYVALRHQHMAAPDDSRVAVQVAVRRAATGRAQ